MSIKHQLIIGRTEIIEFPQYFITSVPAKVDTGAYRSAVHCIDIVESTKNGKPILSFKLLGKHLSSVYSREVTTTNFSKAMIENSFGVSEERYAISLKVKIGNKVFNTDFTLADRSNKPYPVLLGRKTLNGRFLVNTNINNIDRRELLDKMHISMPPDEEEATK